MAHRVYTKQCKDCVLKKPYKNGTEICTFGKSYSPKVLRGNLGKKTPTCNHAVLPQKVVATW